MIYLIVLFGKKIVHSRWKLKKNKRIITQIMFSISISLKFYFYNTSFVSTDEIGPMRRFKDGHFIEKLHLSMD